eukprot:CAMPEP_0183507404 /NCGR_PEP_ID=MMETSP0371-20130417/8200_1 /TAXON_ID=268820 /ORGANISM="Peridinium aciculiferum, Strain PAER-2" /LENGTH=101 /DNA_ID=CAMNT_0025703611 /DNA_START=17 /DNA_END=319 /DNA_ORIENTATION=-
MQRTCTCTYTLPDKDNKKQSAPRMRLHDTCSTHQEPPKLPQLVNGRATMHCTRHKRDEPDVEESKTEASALHRGGQAPTSSRQGATPLERRVVPWQTGRSW